MPTLQELMDDMDLLSEKTASDETSGAADPEVEQLAAQVGLSDSGEKLAAAGNLEGLYSEFFPDDTLGLGGEKTASEEKVAHEERLGERAYDYFAVCFDRAVEKIATDKLASAVDAPVASEAATKNPHADTRPEQQLPNNYAGNGGKPINTTPTYTDEVSKTNDSRTVGHYEQRPVTSQKTAGLAGALRKHMLLASLEQ